MPSSGDGALAPPGGASPCAAPQDGADVEARGRLSRFFASAISPCSRRWRRPSANLRGRLRAMLAARTPAMARLAVVDAVMERALSRARAQVCWPPCPGLLGGALRALARGRAGGAGRRRGRRERARQVSTRRMAGRVSARTCRACCSPNWMFVFNRSKGCSPPFAPANWDAMSRYLLISLFFWPVWPLSCWIGAGYVGSNPLALAVTTADRRLLSGGRARTATLQPGHVHADARRHGPVRTAAQPGRLARRLASQPAPCGAPAHRG